MKRLICAVGALFFILLPAQAAALSIEDMNAAEDAEIYTLETEDGAYLTSHAGRVYVEDEYISSDNQLYVVARVDDGARRAFVIHMGKEPTANAQQAREAFAYAQEESGRKLICMYSTHSDESYIPGDGDASLNKGAGIYDVGEALKKELEKLGIEVKLDETSHLPHDAKAYSRSRRTAEELLKSSPDALLDIHRDGIPDESEYAIEMDGEDASRVRLLVGRSNPNSSANREFAKQIKAVADEKYDGLIKDIFVGKGDYNQGLYPKALLLEFGTHTLDKDRAIASTSLMADVLNTVLYGDSANAAPAGKDGENKAGGMGILWLVLIAALGGVIYALISSGTLKGFGARLARGANEITGGAFGRKKRDE